jgi:hypothetical protein
MGKEFAAKMRDMHQVVRECEGETGTPALVGAASAPTGEA